MSNPVLIKQYTQVTGRRLPTYPLVEVKITVGKKEKSVDALVDTGYDGNLILSHKAAQEIGLTDTYKIQKEVDSIQVANGNAIQAYLYESKVRVGNIEGDMSFNVVGKDVNLIWRAILGRNALDTYEVIFDEKSSPKILRINT